jgi:hypothetical protein
MFFSPFSTPPVPHFATEAAPHSPNYESSPVAILDMIVFINRYNNRPHRQFAELFHQISLVQIQ